MYTDIYTQSYASHTTYQGRYTDIYMQSYASHTTYQNMYTMQMQNAKIKTHTIIPLNCPVDK